MTMIDDVKSICEINDRFQFAQKMKSLASKLPEEIKGTFDMPKTFNFENTTTLYLEERLASFNQSLDEINLKLPVLFKLREGNRAKYAHIFIMVNN
jgi:hypothetical protein